MVSAGSTVLWSVSMISAGRYLNRNKFNLDRIKTEDTKLRFFVIETQRYLYEQRRWICLKRSEFRVIRKQSRQLPRKLFYFSHKKLWCLVNIVNYTIHVPSLAHKDLNSIYLQKMPWISVIESKNYARFENYSKKQHETAYLFCSFFHMKI